MGNCVDQCIPRYPYIWLVEWIKHKVSFAHSSSNPYPNRNSRKSSGDRERWFVLFPVTDWLSWLSWGKEDRKVRRKVTCEKLFFLFLWLLLLWCKTTKFCVYILLSDALVVETKCVCENWPDVGSPIKILRYMGSWTR